MFASYVYFCVVENQLLTDANIIQQCLQAIVNVKSFINCIQIVYVLFIFSGFHCLVHNLLRR